MQCSAWDCLARRRVRITRSVNIKRSFNFISIYFCYTLYYLLFASHQNELDSMENFISDLTTRELNKWNELRREAINRNQSQSFEIASSDEQQRLIDEIHSCLDTHESCELEKLIRKYLHASTDSRQSIAILPRIVLLEVMEFACRNGDVEIYKSLIAHLKERNLCFMNEHMTYFEIIELELEWKTAGNNVDEILEKFSRKYLELSQSYSDEVLKNKIKSHKSMLRKLGIVMIDDTIASKGESAAIKLRESIEKICEVTRDYQLMFDLWRKLFER